MSVGPVNRMFCTFCAIVLVLLVPAIAAAQGRDLIHAEAARKALIIGNNAYAKAPALRNAVNDANDLGASLREVGFQVEVLTDADRQSMERAILRFTGSLGSGDVALFHFSGHGLQIDGENYLIPVDFALTDEVGAKYDAYAASEIHDRMAASKAALNILTLDACRNNGFRSFRGGGGAGLAAMHGAQGSFLAFATAPGETADDNREGRNGAFTGAMLEALHEPGLELEQVFRRVREIVIGETAGVQVPWTSSSVVGNFYFAVVTEDSKEPESSGDNIALQIELASSLPGLSSDPPVVRQGTQPSVAPVFQNGSVRVTVIGTSLDRFGRNARLSLAIDNISREPIFLALQPDSSNQPMIILNDDQGRTWDTSAKDVSGVKVLIDCRRPGFFCGYGGGTITEQNFTMIDPAERSMLVMNFTDAAKKVGGNYTFSGSTIVAPGVLGGTFTFNAQVIRYTASGQSNFSIALAGIKIGVASGPVIDLQGASPSLSDPIRRSTSSQ